MSISSTADSNFKSSSMAESIVTAKMDNIRQTLESIHSQSNSLLHFSVQWKDLEDYFTSVSDAIVTRTEEMELKSQKIEWRRKYVSKKEAEIELKEQRLYDKLERLRKYKRRLKRKFEKRELKLEEMELRIDEFNSRKEKLGFVEMELLQRLAEVELKEKRFDEKLSEAKMTEGGNIRVCNDVKVKIEPLDECNGDGDGILVDPSYADIKIDVTLDGRSLQMFLNGRVNEHEAMQCEVFSGLTLSSDPAKLVLDAIVGFYPEELESGDVGFDLNVVRKSCILLLEVLVKMKPRIKIRVRERAMRVAMEWKGKMNVGDDDHYMEVVGFLWLVATYGLTYDKDELMRLFEGCLCHNPAPELCRSLGLTGEIHVVIRNLVIRDQPFEAMRLIYAFELVDMFPPVPMLKAHLASTIAHAEQLYKGNPSIEVEINCKTAKLAALVSVVKCIKEYGLESNYQVQPLEDQISELKMQNKVKAQIHASMAHENTPNAEPLTPTISDAPSKDPNCFNPFLSSTMITSGRVLDPHNPLPSSTMITPKSTSKILPQRKTRRKTHPRLAPPVVTSRRALEPHNPHFLPYASIPIHPHLPPSRPTHMFSTTAHNGGYFVKRYHPYS